MNLEVVKCRKYIAEGLRSGLLPSLEQTAAALELSVRTLQRRLEQQNMVYRDLVDTTRRGLAEQLVLDSSLSLVQVALLLGFSEQSAFNRAFRRWFGTTPSELRGPRRMSLD